MPPENDELRALGGYVYEFSRMVHWMRLVLPLMASVDLPGEMKFGNINKALRLHTGDMAAQQLIDVYFAVAELVGDYTQDEAHVAAAMRKQTIALPVVRNHFVHGEWQIGSWRGVDNGDGTGSKIVFSLSPETGETQVTQGERVPPTLSRTQAGRQRTTKESSTEYEVNDLDMQATKVREVRHMITEWGFIVAKYPVMMASGESSVIRPGDLFVISDKQVRREGQHAEQVRPGWYP